MYLEHFKLKEPPFKLTPDPRFLSLTTQHEEAIGKSVLLVRDHGGMAVIFGEVGMGKTTIARRLLEILGEDPTYKVVYLASPALKSEFAFLKAIMSEFDVAPKRNYHLSLVAFQEYLWKAHQDGITIILLIDEAQKLTPKMMDVLHTLDNFETNTDKLLQRLLIGQKQLADNIDAIPEINSRVAMWAELKNLNLDDTRELIAFRWHAASGGKGQDPFTEEAIEAIHKYSRGLPREINKICHESLIRAAFVNSNEVTPEMVLDAALELRLAREEVTA